MKRTKTHANNELSSEYQHNFHVFVSFVSNTVQWHHFFLFCFCVCVSVGVRVCEAAMCRAKIKSNKQKRNNLLNCCTRFFPNSC